MCTSQGILGRVAQRARLWKQGFGMRREGHQDQEDRSKDWDFLRRPSSVGGHPLHPKTGSFA